MDLNKLSKKKLYRMGYPHKKASNSEKHYTRITRPKLILLIENRRKREAELENELFNSEINEEVK